MLSVVKMLLKGEAGGSALNSHGNYIVDHGKIMELCFRIFVRTLIWVFTGSVSGMKMIKITLGYFPSCACSIIFIKKQKHKAVKMTSLSAQKLVKNIHKYTFQNTLCKMIMTVKKKYKQHLTGKLLPHKTQGESMHYQF